MSTDALAPPAPPVPVRMLTFRAVATGAALGALLSVCNVYSGLKIGWGFNMSIVAALLSFGFWGALSRAFGTQVLYLDGAIVVDECCPPGEEGHHHHEHH